MGAPSKGPPTLPSFARNSAMVFAFQSSVSLMSNSCRSRSRGMRWRVMGAATAVLHDRLGVPVSLVDDALGLIFVEVDLILQRPGVLGPHDVHGLRGQALELLDLPLVKLEPSDTFYLTQLPRPPVVCDPVRCADRSCPARSRAAAASSRIG